MPISAHQPFRDSSRAAPVGGALVLCVSLALTAILWRRAAHDEELKNRSLFLAQVNDAEDRILKRMTASEQVLWGVRAIFAGSSQVDRQEFLDYAQALELDRYSPGIQAIGFVKYVPHDALQAHLLAQRRVEPSYSLNPPGDRPEYGPIVYLSPYEGRNLVASGFDMLSEPVRRAAMELARDEGRSVLSGRVRLVQEPEQELQTGTLMYVPVWESGSTPPGLLSERRAHLEGWVYLAFRMGDLMRATLAPGDEIATRLYDGETMGADTLLFDSTGDRPAEPVRDALVVRRRLVILGRPWTLVMEARPKFGAAVASRTPEVIATSGAGLSVVLGALVWVLLGARARAERRARAMNRELLVAHAELERSEERLRQAIRGGDLVTWEADLPSGRVLVNERYGQLLGQDPPRLEWTTADLVARIHPEDLPRQLEAQRLHDASRSAGYSVEIRVRREDGAWVWALVNGAVAQRGVNGEALRVVGTMLDISARKQAEEERTRLVERFASAERAAAMATLANGLAHEINNPLAVVLSNLHFARDELARPLVEAAARDVREALQDAEEAAGRVRDLVADLNAFTASQQSPNAKADVKRVIEQSVHELHARGLNGVPIGVDLPPLPAVAGPERELVQLFEALIANALQASTPERTGPVRISGEVHDGHVVVRVVDHGAGMTPEVLRHAADPFFTTRGPGRGKGLGLPVAIAIARSVGGQVEVESQPGAGTTVTVSLVEAGADRV